ncbi:MAG: Cys-rich peptide radical SAM maturase CcpM [Eubacteriaceae bacterium]|nr:Cys-rich peptide radical SAM maturase CcpM [Eubacteriaceae bacterium]
MEEIANVHIFRCGKWNFFFDVNKNAIIEITKEAYNHLQHNLEINYIKENKELLGMYDKGFLSSNRPTKIEHPFTNHVNELLRSNIIKICLQVTQKCNFRCSYCVYSGGYYNRTHSDREMTWEIAKKSIDFLIEHSFDTDLIDVGFYGGEPLLRYDFIEKCIDYTMSQAEGKKVTFSITTNGSLLTEHMVEKFMKSNVDLVISLDGPKVVQDRNRCFINGEGTFDTVYNNLTKLLKKYPRLEKCLSINMVIDQSRDPSPIIDFVSQNNSAIGRIDISAATIADEWRKAPIKECNAFEEQWEYGHFRYMLYMLGRIKKCDKDLRLWKDQFLRLKIFAENTKKDIRSLQNIEHPSGPCVPGQLRLFINAKGLFFPCERVSESTKDMIIGSVEDGFHFDKVKKLLNVGKLTEEECKNCFAIRNCTICATAVDDGGSLSRERKLKTCPDVRYSFEEMLRDLCVLKKCGYNLAND